MKWTVGRNYGGVRKTFVNGSVCGWGVEVEGEGCTVKGDMQIKPCRKESSLYNVYPQVCLALVKNTEGIELQEIKSLKRRRSPKVVRGMFRDCCFCDI